MKQKYKSTPFKEFIAGRKVVLRSLVGSRNYGLDTEESDYDFKYFVLPTLQDLLDNKMVSISNKKDENRNDIDVKDIRLLASLLKKGNIAYAEISFSKELLGDKYIIAFLRANKQNFIYQNAQGFVNGTIGISFEKNKAIFKDLPSEPTNEGFDRRMRYGFDGKQTLHIFRLRSLFYQALNCKEISFQSVNPYTKEMLIGLKEAILQDYPDVGNFEKLTKQRAIEIGNNLIQEMKNISDLVLEKLLSKKPSNDINKDFLDLIHWLIKKNIIEGVDWNEENNEGTKVNVYSCPKHLDFTEED